MSASREKKTNFAYFDAFGYSSCDMGHKGAHFSDGPSAEEPGVVVVAPELSDDQKGFAQEIPAICKRNLTGINKIVSWGER